MPACGARVYGDGMSNGISGRAPFETILQCRLCGDTELKTIISLGMHALADFTQRASRSWQYAPLELVECTSCSLVQLRHTVKRDTLFKNYAYRSGTSEMMRASLAEVAAVATKRVELGQRDVVMDIGANDGTLLDCFGGDRVGFEPSNITPLQATGNFQVVNDYFTENAWHGVMGKRKAKIIFTVAMMYSVETPIKFTHEIAATLDPKGLWVCQMNDLGSLVERTAYDFIGHEHVIIYSMKTLEYLLRSSGLEIVEVEWLEINGGTLRFFIQHEHGPLPITPSVQEYRERDAHLDLAAFARRVGESSNALHDRLRDLTKAGKVTHIYGASTRGSTIVQTARLESSFISMAAERAASKWGNRFPGTTIQMVSEEESREAKPDYYLALPYSYMPQFIEREHEFLERGGEFIVPLPDLNFVTKATVGA